MSAALSRHVHIISLLLSVALSGCATQPKSEVGDGAARDKRQYVQYCDAGNEAKVSSVVIPDVPRWFFKPLPDRKIIAYRGLRTNKFLHLQTGLSTVIPGDNDPIPTPDGRFVALPGITLVPVKQLLQAARGTRLTELAFEMPGEYHSLGWLRETDAYVDYRVMSGRENIALRDVRVRLQDGEPLSAVPLTDRRRPCPQLKLHLPILSKDGSAFGAYDVDTRSTKIFNLDSEGECTEADDLGFATGKVAFSYDGRYIAFHMRVEERPVVGPGKSPQDRMIQTVFVYDRHTREIARVTHNETSHSYFPAFVRDGSLVHLLRSEGGNKGGFSFVISRPSRIKNWVSLDWVTHGCVGEHDDDACLKTAAIGGLWALACANPDPLTRTKRAGLYALNLTAESCRALVDQTWLQRRRQLANMYGLFDLSHQSRLLGLSAATLRSACPRR